ncbi:MAG: protein kinase, partial [Candidatus Woesearchaeota archaeon]
GYNPEQRHMHSCFSVPGIRNKDVFSATVMLYALLTGDVPFTSSEPKEIMQQIMDKSYIDGMSQVSRKMRKMISNAFNKVMVGQEYSVSDFKRDLAKASGKSTSRSYFDYKNYRERMSWEHLKQAEMEMFAVEAAGYVLPPRSGAISGTGEGNDIADVNVFSDDGGSSQCRVGNHVYTGVRKMSVGGSAEVFEATLHDLGYPVVLKKLRDRKPSADLSQEAIDFLKQKFASEAVLSFQLQSANVIKPVNYSASEGVMVFERIDGLDLRDVNNLVADGMSEIEAMVTAEWACYALEEAHKKGIVHRDISPGNMMIQNRSFRALLADFGVAATKDDMNRGDSGEGSVTAGTKRYMSPEQRTFLKIDGRSDIYGLGMVLKELFIRRNPMHVDMEQKRLPMSKDAAEICRKATRPSPEERYQSVEKLREGIKSYLFKRGIESIEDMESVLEGVLKKAYSQEAKEGLKHRIEDAWADIKYLSEKLDKSSVENDMFRGVAEQRRDIVEKVFEDELVAYVNRPSNETVAKGVDKVRKKFNLPGPLPNSKKLFSSLKKVRAILPEQFEQAYTEIYKHGNDSEKGAEKFRKAFSDHLSDKLDEMTGYIATMRKIDPSGYSDLVGDVEGRVENVIKMFASKQFLKVDTDMQRYVLERYDRALRYVKVLLMQLDPENQTYVRLAKKIEKKMEEFSKKIETQENGSK